MTDPIRIVPKAVVAQAELAAQLREVADQAERGEIAGIVIVKLRPDQCFAVNKFGDCSSLQLAGALAFAMHDLIVANSPATESPR